jgi:hypothetical protein
MTGRMSPSLPALLLSAANGEEQAASNACVAPLR